MVSNPVSEQISGRLWRGSMQYLRHAPIWARDVIGKNVGQQASCGESRFSGQFHIQEWSLEAGCAGQGSDMIEQHHY